MRVDARIELRMCAISTSEAGTLSTEPRHVRQATRMLGSESGAEIAFMFLYQQINQVNKYLTYIIQYLPRCAKNGRICFVILVNSPGFRRPYGTFGIIRARHWTIIRQLNIFHRQDTNQCKKKRTTDASLTFIICVSVSAEFSDTRASNRQRCTSLIM